MTKKSIFLIILIPILLIIAGLGIFLFTYTDKEENHNYGNIVFYRISQLQSGDLKHVAIYVDGKFLTMLPSDSSIVIPKDNRKEINVEIYYADSISVNDEKMKAFDDGLSEEEKAESFLNHDTLYAKTEERKKTHKYIKYAWFDFEDIQTEEEFEDYLNYYSDRMFPFIEELTLSFPKDSNTYVEIDTTAGLNINIRKLEDIPKLEYFLWDTLLPVDREKLEKERK